MFNVLARDVKSILEISQFAGTILDLDTSLQGAGELKVRHFVQLLSLIQDKFK